MDENIISINGNEATFSFPPDWPTKAVLTVSSDSPLPQKIELSIDGNNQTITGPFGEPWSEKMVVPGGTSKVVAKFFHTDGKQPSALQFSGPISLGSSVLMMVVAEDGDDEDFNDVVLQIKARERSS
ncbi:hypothetical protein Q7P36_006996 [Cladosporium allicinum]